jgi:DNA-binding transcriptional regulator GbsR (MarR family)
VVDSQYLSDLGKVEWNMFIYTSPVSLQEMAYDTGLSVERVKVMIRELKRHYLLKRTGREVSHYYLVR